MKYEILKEHDTHFEIKHPDGSSFNVAKSGLKDNVMGKIKKLPVYMAEGGVVPSLDVTFPEDKEKKEEINIFDQSFNPQQNQIPNQILKQGQYNPETYTFLPGLEDPSKQGVTPPESREIKFQEPVRAPAQTEGAMVSEPMQKQSRVFGPESGTSQQQVKSSGSDLMKGINQSFNQIEKGYKDIGDAQATGLNETAKIHDENQKRMNEAIELHKASRAKLDADHEKISNDIMTSKLDPNKVWNNMSTGSKIGAAISVLFSGIGAGLSGQQNMAMKVLDDTMNKDIEAQKAELGKKENLLSNNIRKYGALDDALKATMMELNATVQGQIAAVAARSGSKEAQANAVIHVGKLEQQRAVLANEIAQKQASQQAMKQLSSGGSSDFVNSLPEEIRKRYVEGEGFRGVARTEKQAEQLNTSSVDTEQASSMIDDLIAIGKKSGRETFPTEAKAQAQVISQMLIGKLRVPITGPGAMSESEQKILKDIIANPTDVSQVNAISVLNKLKDTLNNNLYIQAKKAGLNMVKIDGAKKLKASEGRGKTE